MISTNSLGTLCREGLSATANSAGDETEHADRGPLLLVVEDDQQAKEGLTEYLVGQGYRVSDAKDGAEALLKVETYLPDVVLLDLALPGIDGWAVTRRLRSDQRFKRIAVIAMSWLDYPDQVGRAFEAGCDAFLPKPVDLRCLVPLIEQVMEPR
jgi:CheY-like chemotaxis protein